MEFWGIEVAAGKPVDVQVEYGHLLHLSQAALGDIKEDTSEFIQITVNMDDGKYVLGTLSPQKIPQIAFDLVFESNFELSHNGKNGSVFFCGYMSPDPDMESELYDSESEDEDALVPLENGNLKEKAKSVEMADASKPKVLNKKIQALESEEDSDEDDSDDEANDDLSDSDDDEIGDASDDDDEDEESDEDDEDDEEVPELSKKTLPKTGKAPNTVKKAEATRINPKLVKASKNEKTSAKVFDSAGKKDKKKFNAFGKMGKRMTN